MKNLLYALRQPPGHLAHGEGVPGQLMRDPDACGVGGLELGGLVLIVRVTGWLSLQV